MQLDKGYKGFSFSKEGPLDMRMDPEASLTAEEIVNRWPEKELARIFAEYGEEPRWRRAAKAVVDARKKQPITTTTQLARIICDCFGRSSKKKLHPATLIFQALRICVNHELDAIQEALEKTIRFLNKHGRVGVISFHRLEDRIVKSFFKTNGIVEGKKKSVGFAPLKLLTKKPIAATLREIFDNPRSRSAKLRFAEKI